MKKILLVALPLLLLVGGSLRTEASTVEEMLVTKEVTNPNEIQDLTEDMANLSTQKRTRSGETEYTISYDDLENIHKEAYKKQYPDYTGEIKFLYEDEEGILTEEPDEVLVSDQMTVQSRAVITTSQIRSSIGKISATWYNKAGYIIHQSHGTAFRFGSNRAATAAHVLYNPTYGWPSSYVMMFGATSTNTGMKYTALYPVTPSISGLYSQDLAQKKFDLSTRADFGLLKLGSRTIGTDPGYTSLTSAGTAYSNVTAYGYQGSTYNFAYSKGSSVSIYKKYPEWYDWVFQGSFELIGGMSGGPLLNSGGSAIGINCSYFSSSNRACFLRITSNVKTALETW